MFALKHIFYPGQPIYARQIEENFSDIEAELNSFPTSGSFKAGVLATTNFDNASITGDKFELNGTFYGQPTYSSTPSEPNSLVNKKYVDDQMATILGAYTGTAGSMGAGVGTGLTATPTKSTSAYIETDVITNGTSTLYVQSGFAPTTVSTGTTLTITLDSTYIGTGVCAANITPVYSANATYVGAITNSTYSSFYGYIDSAWKLVITSNAALSSVNGFFFIVFSATE
jgi:hypothetical protein